MKVNLDRLIEANWADSNTITGQITRVVVLREQFVCPRRARKVKILCQREMMILIKCKPCEEILSGPSEVKLQSFRLQWYVYLPDCECGARWPIAMPTCTHITTHRESLRWRLKIYCSSPRYHAVVREASERTLDSRRIWQTRVYCQRDWIDSELLSSLDLMPKIMWPLICDL